MLTNKSFTTAKHFQCCKQRTGTGLGSQQELISRPNHASNIAMRTPRLLLCMVLGAVSVLVCVPLRAADALQAVLHRNTEHAGRWLDEGDYKSLAQSAGGLQLLVTLLKAKSDDPTWQSAYSEVNDKIAALQAAARSEEAAQCKAALAVLQKSLTNANKISPTGKPLPAPKAPALRQLMLAMDGIQADAKVALLSGQATTAKQQAQVLAELAALVSSSRNTEKWSDFSADFSKACEAAAASPETDTKSIRPLFRSIAERCEACHEKARDR
jgi:hypothetical protein